MDYISIAEARELSGLRLILSAGVPGPWGEAAKAICAVKNLDYIAVRQEPGGANEELQAWTGQTSAPVAVLDDEPPKVQSVDILYLAERLAPEPALIPDDVSQRATMFGLIREIIGENGFAWCRRLQMLAPLVAAPGMEELAGRMSVKYGFSEQALSQSVARCVEILTLLVSCLERQQAAGSPYFIGDKLTALDIYWANFAGMVAPLPADQNPMDAGMRKTYEIVPEEVKAACKPILLQHRDFIYKKHLTLPLDF